MKEITEITYRKDDNTFIAHMFDDDSGWTDLEIDDMASLKDLCENHPNKIDLESLGTCGIKLLEDPVDSEILSIKTNEGTEVTDKEDNDVWAEFNEHDLDTKIFYVTDIHLDSKILKIYGNNPTSENEESFIQTIVDGIVEEFKEGYLRRKILLIGGDVSHHYHRSELFYRQLTKSIEGKNIMAILGNHEYWDESLYEDGKGRVESVSDSFAKLFDELYISYADDMLFVCYYNGRYFVRGDELLSASDEEIQQFIADSPLTILAGTGFTGKNPEMNSDHGVYRNAIRSRTEDVERSAKFEAIYSKVLGAIPDTKVIVFTHMPVSDWTELGYNPNWIYINGHTHRNILSTTDGSVIRSDNQIGYGGKVHLKSFYLDREYDYFRYRQDGIYEITLGDYYRFYSGMKQSMTCNREGQYIMLKRDNTYCFILKNGDKQFILDGGNIRDASDHDISYYYDNIPRYNDSVNKIMKPYLDRLKMISDTISLIGGSGRIHGCIVDIDFTNHVYLNPFDFTTTAYHATDMINKDVYGSFEMLIEEKRPELFLEYQKMISSDPSKALTNPRSTNKKEHYGGTDIYRVSKWFKKIQYLTEHRIIRRWNDEFLNIPDDQDDCRTGLVMLGNTIGV